jgi:hypothetical protein
MKFQQIAGFRVEIDQILRVFHDRKEVALGLANNLKKKNKHSKVEIVCEATGRRIEMLEDGRTA